MNRLSLRNINWPLRTLLSLAIPLSFLYGAGAAIQKASANSTPMNGFTFGNVEHPFTTGPDLYERVGKVLSSDRNTLVICPDPEGGLIFKNPGEDEDIQGAPEALIRDGGQFQMARAYNSNQRIVFEQVTGNEGAVFEGVGDCVEVTTPGATRGPHAEKSVDPYFGQP